MPWDWLGKKKFAIGELRDENQLMLDILDSLTFRKAMATISVEKYHEMIENGIFDDWDVELLNGVLIKKMSKSELHIFLTDLLVDLVRSFCAEKNLWVRKEDPLTLGNSEPEPDLSVVEGQRLDYRYTKPTTALFVAEVAISSLSIDLAKALDYASAGIPEYWIICPNENEVKVFRDPKNGVYGTELVFHAKETIASASLPGFVFKLSDYLNN